VSEHACSFAWLHPRHDLIAPASCDFRSGKELFMSHSHLFIGLKPAPSCLDTFVQDQARLLHRFPYVRLTQPDHIHLTLLPLGMVHRSRIGHVVDVLERGAEDCEPFDLRVGPLDLLNPKVIWAGVQNGVEELYKLRETIQRAIGPMRRVSVPRLFTPHWSLARLGFEPDEGTRSRIKCFLTEAALPTTGPFKVQRVYLIQSILEAHSVRHDQLASVAIGGVPTGC
jgi:2'-5' RNA ligase